MNHNQNCTKKILSVILLSVIAFLVVLYANGAYDFTFITRPENEKIIPKNPNDIPDTEPEAKEDKPIPQEVQKPQETENPPAEKPVVIQNKSELAGYHITNTLYNAETHKLAAVTPKSEISPLYTVSSGKVRTVTVETDKKGSNNASEAFADGELPYLMPYFGFIIQNTESARYLCDSELNRLCDITGFDTVGYCDLAGHALFKKDGEYYYFYDGENRLAGTVVLDEITPDTALEYEGIPEPDALYLVNAESEVTPTLSGGRGMTKCTVDENYFNDISVNSTYYDRNSCGLYRLCEYRVNKEITNQWQIDDYNNALLQYQQGLLALPPSPVEAQYRILDESFHWWYIDANGNLAIDYSFLHAFEFSDNGLAFVVREIEEDSGNKLCTVNKSGTVMFRAYNTTLFFTERGNASVKDGHYLPDTLGWENTGMLRFEKGLCAVRRKLFDTTNGRVYISDKTEVVNTSGEVVNYPSGYEALGYSDGKILLKKDAKFRFMNTDGSYLTPLEYTDAKPFCEGLAVLCKNGKYGMIDTNSNVILPFEFNYISSASDGVICAYSDSDGWKIFHKVTWQAESEKEINPVLLLKRRLIAQKIKQENVIF